MIPTTEPGAEHRRHAVVDLGSNSVRLVVFDGATRNPSTIFNEKAVLRLGRGIETTGCLNEAGVEQALVVMARFHAIARAMHADPFEVLATAAVRDASNGPAFVTALRAAMPGVPIQILSGEEEAALSAEGVLCGIPHANGILADIGGGSLELVRLDHGRPREARTFSLGVIRLAERAGNDLVRARAIAEADLAQAPWLTSASGGDVYVVGGAWRALARVHMAQIGYPLNILHHYTIRRDEARDLTAMISGIGRRGLERLPDVPRKRIDDLPIAAVVLRRVMRATGAARLVFSANGLREGWLMRHMPAATRAQDPLLAAAMEQARWFSREPDLPQTLFDWLTPLFPSEDPEAARLRRTACWLSDCSSREHPEYRAEHAFARVLHQNGTGLDHHARAFLALAIAMRYEAPPDAAFLLPARVLLDMSGAGRAERLGSALRLAYTLSAGTLALLGQVSLAVEDQRLVLRITGQDVYAGDGVLRRLDWLAQALGMEAATHFA